ncbi:MAG: hypothetical protein GTN38_03920 [Candidatus Aenigmarchaeota archaeon]|nr:hypothetical protein [Candidatus Aenigmarchaeota archaeon]NIP40810.1 hypothetical protein [Candidatus Aenigmarchaeota archaeon]NIQ17924.1 hypothetical protein [Candidatus Aenigmarchaeota archaeon]NIS73513.1 hypothetical protein [Candidatus Aenigmarchaeota archaeon]
MVKIKPFLYKAGMGFAGVNLILNLIGCSPGYKHTFEYKGYQYTANVCDNNITIDFGEEKVNIEFDDKLNLNWEKITVNPFKKDYIEDKKDEVRKLILVNNEKDNLPNEITESLSGLYPFSFGPRGKKGGNIDFSNIENTVWEYNGLLADDVPSEREQLRNFEEFSEKYVGLFEALKDSLQPIDMNLYGSTEFRRRQREFASEQKVLANNQNSKVLGLQNRRRL